MYSGCTNREIAALRGLYVQNRSIDKESYFGPIESLDRIYPASPGGIEPYLYANTGGTYTKEAQDATITISTNVKFRAQVTGGTDWLEIISGVIKSGYPDRVHEATVTSISIRIKANTGSNTSERTGYIYLECIEEGVEINDGNRDKLTTTITIVQSPDEITPMQEEIENFESGVTQALQDMQDEIDNLTPTTGGTGN